MDHYRRPIPNSSNAVRTLDLKPGQGEMIKPAELIDIVGIAHLTLSARRLYNTFVEHAFSPQLGEKGQKFRIQTSALRGAHDSNDRIREDIMSLMRTVAVVRLNGGEIERRVQLLGTTDIVQRGYVEYSFSDELVELLQNSTIFGKLEKSVMLAFSSKYALALYEAAARRVRLKHRFSETFTLSEFRELLGVPYGKLTTFGNLNQYAIKPAVAEINAMAAFGVLVKAKKVGRKVVGVTVGWWLKGEDDLKDAFAEVNRSKVGRKARINDQAENVVIDIPTLFKRA